MAVEIEAKLKIDSADQLNAVRKRLGGSNAIPLAKRIEHDMFFDSPDSSLAESDKALRLRVLLDQKGKLVACVLTFKGPRQAGEYKTREEIELQLHRQYSSTEHILKAIGFSKVLQYQKRRETWQLDKCTVALDQLPELGCFVEIEGPGEEAIGAAIRKLNLTSAQQPSRTYLEMVVDYLKSERPPGCDHLLFDETSDWTSCCK